MRQLQAGVFPAREYPLRNRSGGDLRIDLVSSLRVLHFRVSDGEERQRSRVDDGDKAGRDAERIVGA